MKQVVELAKKIENRLIKMLYWPICRAYVRFILKDKPADPIYRLLCSFQYLKMNGFWPDFINPTRLSEKLWVRMLHDRDPKLTIINDKLKVRDYVSSLVGIDYLKPLLWSGTNVSEIPYDELPSEFVIKANHGCDYNFFVRDKSKLDHIKIKKKMSKWLRENFCLEKHLGSAWGYKNIKPCIIIESLLEDDGKAPLDYKFWCISGRVEFITIHFDRFGDHRMLWLDRNLKSISMSGMLPEYNGEYKLPDNMDEMIRLSDSLAKEFSFVRVDLYNLDKKIYFGELTPYPAGVMIKFEPDEFDDQMGKKWI